MMCDFEVYTVLSVRHILSVALQKDTQKPYRNCEEAARSTKCYYDGHIYIHDNYQYSHMSNKTL